MRLFDVGRVTVTYFIQSLRLLLAKRAKGDDTPQGILQFHCYQCNQCII